MKRLMIIGPFVTDIEYDDEGNLVITKNNIVYSFTSDIHNGENWEKFVIKNPTNNVGTK